MSLKILNFAKSFFNVLLAFGSVTSVAQQSDRALGVDSLTMTRVGRIQNSGYTERLPIDIRDSEIYSPKSVRFSADGRKIYINSLEGGRTVVYSWPELQKLKSISHNFRAADSSLFQGENTVFNYPYYTQSPSGDNNIFLGKPVESELSHGGRWLWIPYYRRGFDTYGQSPSAVAIVDTQTDRIVRVMPTGPIPKYVVASPDGKYMAIIHWGDNTVGLIDTQTGDPRDFTYVAQLTVETQLSQEDKANTDRDATCGFCLRGAVFSKDSQFLMVARMGKGGIAGFHIPSKRYLGSIMNIRSTPRHLVLSPDGEFVYASSNYAGYISKVSVQNLVKSLIEARGRRINGPIWQEVSVGVGARTLDISHDGKILFVAVNNTSELVAVDAQSLQILSRLKVDPFAVGLAVSPDSSAVLLTSQGRSGVGGNAANIIQVRHTVPSPGSRRLN